MIDPALDGVEYIEIYNRGEYPINLKDVYIGLLNGQNVYSYLQLISNVDLAIYPNTYWVICTDKEKLKKQHANANDQIIELNIPALNNSKATWRLVYKDGSLIEETTYDTKWHFMLYSNTKGIALERISLNDVPSTLQN